MSNGTEILGGTAGHSNATAKAGMNGARQRAGANGTGTATEGDRNGRTIQSVERALTILEILASAHEPQGLNDIATQAGLNASTCHHLITTFAPPPRLCLLVCLLHAVWRCVISLSHAT